MKPLRIVGRRLAVPGVIGVRDPHGLSRGEVRHVLIGPDAGFPEGQQLDDWKSELALGDVRALPPEVRKEAGILLPAEERAELEDLDRAMVEAGAYGMSPYADERTLAWLAVEERARLAPLDKQAREVLTAHGYAYWLAGYTRHSDSLWAHRIGGPAPFRASLSQWDNYAEEAPDEPRPSWLDSRRYFELWSTRWFDRMLRALTDGAVTETGLLFATGHGELDEVVEDDLLHEALETAARMAAGADEVHVPMHGLAVRVRLPAFVTRVWDRHPQELPSGEPPRSREVRVPAEDTWILTEDLG